MSIPISVVRKLDKKLSNMFVSENDDGSYSLLFQELFGRKEWINRKYKSREGMLKRIMEDAVIDAVTLPLHKDEQNAVFSDFSTDKMLAHTERWSNIHVDLRKLMVGNLYW